MSEAFKYCAGFCRDLLQCEAGGCARAAEALRWLRTAYAKDAAVAPGERYRHLTIPDWSYDPVTDTVKEDDDAGMDELPGGVVQQALAAWRRVMCWGWCRCRPYEDAGGVGGQCVQCGRIVGYVTRTEMRQLADRMVR